MNFDDLKTNIVNLLKIYRGRGVSLRNEIHPLLASFTFLDRIHTWSSLFVHISELEEDIEPDLLAKLGDLYTKIKTDFNKREFLFMISGTFSTTTLLVSKPNQCCSGIAI